MRTDRDHRKARRKCQCDLPRETALVATARKAYREQPAVMMLPPCIPLGTQFRAEEAMTR